MSTGQVLRPEEVATVLSSEPGGTAGPASAAEGGSRCYSLRRPVAIAPNEEEAARGRLERLGTALERALRDDLGAELALRFAGFQQEQLGTAIETLPQPAWILSFVGAEGGGLALALDPTSALSLVELALGGAGSVPDTGRAPTALEQRVLERLCQSLLPALSRLGGTRFEKGTFGNGRVPAALAAPGQTVGVGLLRVEMAKAERGGLLLASPFLLRERAAAGETRLEIGPLAPRLERMSVRVRPVLDAGPVSLADLAQLEPGTVLRLAAEEGRPFDLQINERDFFKGTLARKDGRLEFHVTWRRGRRASTRGPGARSGKEDP